MSDPPIYFTTKPGDGAISFRDLAVGMREIMQASAYAPNAVLIAGANYHALAAELARRPRTDCDDRVDALLHVMRHTGASRGEVSAALMQPENANAAPLSGKDFAGISPQIRPRNPRR